MQQVPPPTPQPREQLGGAGLNPRPAQALLPPSSSCHVRGRATTLSYYSSRCSLPRITADAGNYLIQKPAFLLHLPTGPQGERRHTRWEDSPEQGALSQLPPGTAGEPALA